MMRVIVSSIFIITVIALSYYYLPHTTSVVISFSILLLHLFNRFNESSKDTFKLITCCDRDFAIIKYRRHNKEHMMMLPYDRASIAHMSRYNIFLKIQDDNSDEDEEVINITHQPGLPYYDMGGNVSWIIKDNLTDEEYTSDTAPLLLQVLSMQEE